MATLTWTGAAAALKQVSTITVANTWATSDTGTVTINGKDLIITVGSSFTTADVATAIKDAFNAVTRLDGLSTPFATSNFGGSEFGEFAEITATVSGSVVTLTGDTAGKPFTFSVAEVTAGSGTLTAATPQAATGPNHWNNGDNWDLGVVPDSVTNNVVVFMDSAISCLYGLPNGSLEVTFNVYQNYTGNIGLARTNIDDEELPYYEYRQRYVRLDDSGAGTDIAHRFGLGDGDGSNLINLKHSTLKCTAVVYDTGTPQITGTKALNLCLTANTSEITVHKGSVDCGSQDGGTAALNVLRVGYDGSQTLDSDVVCQNGVKSGANVYQSGGTLVIGSGPAFTLHLYGGTCRVEDQATTISALNIYSGTVQYASAATITSLGVWSGGTFDASKSLQSFVINSSAVVYRGGTVSDPHEVATWAAPLTVQGRLSESTIDIGIGRALTIA
jgi:hypothetical protein